MSGIIRAQARLALRAFALLCVLVGAAWTLLSLGGADPDAQAQTDTTLTINKTVTGTDLADDFVFTISPTSGSDPGCGATPATTTISGSGSTTVQLTATIGGLVPECNYEVTESAPSGYDTNWEVSYPGAPPFTGATGTGVGPILINLSQDERPPTDAQLDITNAAQGGSFVIVKDTDPDADVGFGFTVADGAGGPLTPFELNDGGGSNTETRLVTPGQYTVTEASNPDYSVSISCDDSASTRPSTTDDASGTATVNVDPGETVTCTFTNTRLTANLNVAKVSGITGDTTDFGFTVMGPTGFAGSSFNLASGATPESLTGVPTGTYTITESDPGPMYRGTNWSCVDTGGATVASGSGLAATVTLTADQDVTCTFTNPGSPTVLKVLKVSDPVDSDEIFAFTATGSVNATFDLDANYTPIDGTPSEEEFSGITPGTVTITEAANGRFSTAVRCTRDTNRDGPDAGDPEVATGAGSVTLTIAEAEFINCIFTNTELGQIIINKQSSIVDDPTPFEFSIIGPQSSAVTLDVDTTTNLYESSHSAFVPAGSYTIRETVPTGYRALWDCPGFDVPQVLTETSVFLVNGGRFECTVTNTATATIEIAKRTNPSGGTGFSFTGALGDFTLDDFASEGQDVTLTGSSFSVTETTTGFAVSIDCTGTNWVASGSTVTIDPDPGEYVRCTYTNTEPSSITIIKNTVPDASLDFSFTGDLGAFTLNDPDGSAASRRLQRTDLAPGTYTVTETADARYATEASCSDPTGDTTTFGATATIELAAGEDITCTFTNLARPGRLVLVKDAQPDSPQDFTFTVVSSSNEFFETVVLDDDDDPTLVNTHTLENLEIGPYEIVEQLESGWILESIECDDGSEVDTASGLAAVVIDPGETVTCTYTNVRNLGTIVIVQDTVPSNPQDFGFTTTDLDPAEFALDDDTDPTLPNSRTFFVDDPQSMDDPPALALAAAVQSAGLAPGTYSVTGAGAPGWTTTLSCDDPDGGTIVSALTATIDLDAGETVTCTYRSEADRIIRRIPGEPEPDPDSNAVEVVPVSEPTETPDEVIGLALTGSNRLPSLMGLGLLTLGFGILGIDRYSVGRRRR
ncbi:MAG: DUF5979 domain-containing protein [Actinomycetota bacterium]